MKKFLFVSLLTGLFTTGCTLDNNTLNTVNKAMNVLGQVANNSGVGEASADKTSDNQASNDEISICSAKGWKTAYVTNQGEDYTTWLDLQLNGVKVSAYCDEENCKKQLIGKRVKVKLDYNSSELGGEDFDVGGCWINQIKVLN